MSEDLNEEKAKREAEVQDVVSDLARLAIEGGKISISLQKGHLRFYTTDVGAGEERAIDSIPDTEIRRFTLPLFGPPRLQEVTGLLKENGISPEGFILTSLEAIYEEEIRLRKIGEQPKKSLILVGKGRGGPGAFFEIEERLEGDRFKLMKRHNEPLTHWITEEGFLRKGQAITHVVGPEKTEAFLIGLGKLLST